MQSTKHIDSNYHIFREQLWIAILKILPTMSNFADILPSRCLKKKLI